MEVKRGPNGMGSLATNLISL